MEEEAADIMARQIGYENDEQKALALALAHLCLEALKAAGFDLVKREPQ